MESEHVETVATQSELAKTAGAVSPTKWRVGARVEWHIDANNETQAHRKLDYLLAVIEAGCDDCYLGFKEVEVMEQ